MTTEEQVGVQFSQYCTDPAHLLTAGHDLDDLDRDLSDDVTISGGKKTSNRKKTLRAARRLYD